LNTLLQVLETEPPRPRTLDATVDRDLETICLRCLHKEPTKRYSSVEALADDLERWLRGEPIQARRVGTLERAAKWARRRPATAARLGVIAVALASVTGLLFALWVQAEERAATESTLNQQLEEQVKTERDLKAELAKKVKREQDLGDELADKLQTEKKLGRTLRDEIQLKNLALADAVRSEEKALQQLSLTRQALFGAQLAQAAALCATDPRTAKQLLEDGNACPPLTCATSPGAFMPGNARCVSACVCLPKRGMSVRWPFPRMASTWP
jgi:hypothetical protein